MYDDTYMTIMSFLILFKYVYIVITPCSEYMYFSLQKGLTALMIASEGQSEGHFECGKLLLEKGAEVNHSDGVSAESQSIIVCSSCYLV